MSFFYDYLGADQDLLVESDVPRPDLLEWAYWREIDADEAARLTHTHEPEHASVVETATTASDPTATELGDASVPSPDTATPEPEAKTSTPRKASAKKAA